MIVHVVQHSDIGIAPVSTTSNLNGQPHFLLARSVVCCVLKYSFFLF